MALLARLLVVGALAVVGFLGAAPAHADVASSCSPTCSSGRTKRSGGAQDERSGTSTTTEPEATTTTLAPLGGDAPSIIRRPGEETDRPANTLGVVVGVVMLLGWIAGGAIMFLRAHRRRNR